MRHPFFAAPSLRRLSAAWRPAPRARVPRRGHGHAHARALCVLLEVVNPIHARSRTQLTKEKWRREHPRLHRSHPGNGADMRLVHYASATFRTGDDVAVALLDYARELIEWDRCDSISLPIYDTDGTTRRAHLLLTPASTLVTVDTTGPTHGPDDGPALEDLRLRHQWLRTTPAVGITLEDFGDLLWLDIPDPIHLR